MKKELLFLLLIQFQFCISQVPKFSSIDCLRSIDSSYYISFETDTTVFYRICSATKGGKCNILKGKARLNYIRDTMVLCSYISNDISALDIYNIYNNKTSNDISLTYESFERIELSLHFLDSNNSICDTFNIYSNETLLLKTKKQYYYFSLFVKGHPNYFPYRGNVSEISGKCIKICLDVGTICTKGCMKFFVKQIDSLKFELSGPIFNNYQGLNKAKWIQDLRHNWPWNWIHLSKEHYFDLNKNVFLKENKCYLPFVHSPPNIN